MNNEIREEIKELINLETELFGKPSLVDGGSRDGWLLVAVWGDTGRTKARVQTWVHPVTGQTDTYFGLETVQFNQYRKQIHNAYAFQALSGTRAHRKSTENVLKFDSVKQCMTVFATWGERYGVCDTVKDAIKDTTKVEVKTA